MRRLIQEYFAIMDRSYEQSWSSSAFLNSGVSVDKVPHSIHGVGVEVNPHKVLAGDGQWDNELTLYN